LRHYDTGDWLLYRDNRIGEKQRRLMENHLALCNRCLQTYLATITEREAHRAGELLLADFGTSVLIGIRVEEKEARGRRRARSLLNYAVAAAITLILMSSGLFDLLPRELPGILAGTGQITQVIENTTCWDMGVFLENARTRVKKIHGNKEK